MVILFLLFSGIILQIIETLIGGFSRNLYALIVSFIINTIAFILFIVMLDKEKRLIKINNKTDFSKGIGFSIITSLFLSFSFSRISLATVIGMIILGQNFSLSIVDSYGWFNRERQDAKIIDAPGILLAIVGIILFIDGSYSLAELISLVVSFLAGMTSFFATMYLFEEKENAPIFNSKSRLNFTIFSVIISIIMDALLLNNYSKVSIVAGVIISLASVICNILRLRYEIYMKHKLEYYNHIVEEEHKHRDYIVSKWLETMNEK